MIISFMSSGQQILLWRSVVQVLVFSRVEFSKLETFHGNSWKFMEVFWGNVISTAFL